MESVSALPRFWLLAILLALALWGFARLTRALRRQRPPSARVPVPRPDPLALAAQARALCAEGRFREAEPLYRAALAAQRPVSGRGEPMVAVLLEGLGAALAGQGRAGEAEYLFDEAVRIRRAAAEPLALAAALEGWAAALAASGRSAEAAEAAGEARALLAREGGA